MTNEFPQALTIAGSDSDGSAGIEADLRSFFQCHVYGLVIQTTAVAGNSYGVFDRCSLPNDFIRSEFTNLASDFKIRAAKTGMLPDSQMISLVAEEYQKTDFGPLVVDPVIVSKHGAILMDEPGVNTLREKLLPLSTVITPNFKEAQALTELQIKDDQLIKQAAKKMQSWGAKNVMIKGAHNFESEQKSVRDFVLLADGSTFWLENDYVDTKRINGTGDTLSAIITAELAKGKNVKDAIIIANKNTYRALKQPINVGHQYGPINHWQIKEDLN
ncbi:bifunctional hydroxymethylpyrimidine kinase/phosphomethylpyrimidine kinase [Xylocopilactobacillus apicola]|uniref:Hydroxymethylpyrimidine/phosphomethylpyrimidine kinase n=1 Tax=Xylocopilactobacillus apicola TaxID=2932184 RepID=A0AAU9D4A3_9LACO|nr:bifunctional hydroxymethylpyrimidine kinase/phosphomethylpyrimidine kinase [Xylocopilactobacillus apicola]BDR58599.1 hydroxymethylpyrimidine/phosphomethylpyrimidine kinase [Xylocopilactobacillus apicola]